MYTTLGLQWISILTWHRGRIDQEGCTPRARLAIALRLAESCDSPKRGELGRIIYGSGDLRSRYFLQFKWKVRQILPISSKKYVEILLNYRKACFPELDYGSTLVQLHLKPSLLLLRGHGCHGRGHIIMSYTSWIKCEGTSQPSDGRLHWGPISSFYVA